ncbi:MAG: Spy/CpxP family protein refolding chaperone [Rhodothermales bacterium]|nr:Spy/CpxP family protein refolding chaperone [Rhodothermales bacterium]MBO6779216.1 Spy/CpxP family protein refolding chaperone [Rhodothermales bacterium]
MRLTVFALGLLLVTPAVAQHDHGASPYVDLQSRAIKALSDQEIADLEAGNGMGFALPAELNGYPGPKHVLEMAETLRLTDPQLEQTQALFERMQTATQAMGKRLIALERDLDAAFAGRQIDEQQLVDLTSAAGAQRAAIRAEHLRAHLAMMDILTSEQVHQYRMARGYHGGH